MLTALLTALYVACVLLLTAYAISGMILLINYLRHARNLRPASKVRHASNKTQLPPFESIPNVVVQLPVYNEPFVVERLLDAVAALQYPREKLEIQVLDDSTDETTAIIAEKIHTLEHLGLNIQHIRRETREGFKAGALKYGLTLTDAEFAVIFDADFTPAPDYLYQVIPHIAADPKMAFIQARWGHLNDHENALTMSQRIVLDAHFVVEQTARARGDFMMNFNGSGGAWRIAAIYDAGDWRDDTLTEDFDLSYRAQLKGWHGDYVPHVVVPAEIPPTLNAYKQQQARWAKGGTQVLAILFVDLWKSSKYSTARKLMATAHLCQYVVQPLMVVLILLTPILLQQGALLKIPLGSLGVFGIFPPMMLIIGQVVLYRDWARRLLPLPVLVLLSTGMSFANSRAVISGLVDTLRGKKSEFRRTPKYANKGRKVYAARLNINILGEIALSLYALWGVWVSLKLAPTLTPYLALYSIAYGLVALWSLRESLRGKLKQAPREVAITEVKQAKPVEQEPVKMEMMP